MSLFFMSVFIISILTLFDLIGEIMSILNINKKHIIVFLAVTVFMQNFDIIIAPEFSFNTALLPTFVLIPYFSKKRGAVNMKRLAIPMILAGLIMSIVFKITEENVTFILCADCILILIFAFIDSPFSGICVAAIIPAIFGMCCTVFDIIKYGFGFLILDETIVDMQFVGLIIGAIISEVRLAVNKNKFESRRI